MNCLQKNKWQKQRKSFLNSKKLFYNAFKVERQQNVFLETETRIMTETTRYDVPTSANQSLLLEK